MDYQMILNQIAQGLYKVSIPYPESPVKPRINKDASADDAEDYAKKKRVYDDNMEGYRVLRQEYHEVEAELRQKFYDDVVEMLVEAGATEEQARKAYGFAWYRGHASGLHEVALIADDLCKIFRR